MVLKNYLSSSFGILDSDCNTGSNAWFTNNQKIENIFLNSQVVKGASLKPKLYFQIYQHDNWYYNYTLEKNKY